jgi:hypothetical protein
VGTKASVAVAAALLLCAGCGADEGVLAPSLGESFTLAPGDAARLDGAGVSVTFVRTDSDSRCATGAAGDIATVECVWEGVADVHLSVSVGAEAAQDLHLPTTDSHGFSRDAVLGGYRFSLLDLRPAPRVGPIPEADYRLTLVVSGD